MSHLETTATVQSGKVGDPIARARAQTDKGKFRRGDANAGGLCRNHRNPPGEFPWTDKSHEFESDNLDQGVGFP